MIHPSELKKFKKISSDAHSTVLQHPAGHKITIAHKALSEKMKQDLHSIPHLAEGGEVKKDPPPIDKDKAKQIQDSFKGALGFADGGPVGIPGININFSNPYQSVAQNDAPVPDYASAVPQQEDLAPSEYGIPGKLHPAAGPDENPYAKAKDYAYQRRRDRAPWEPEEDSDRYAVNSAYHQKQSDQADAKMQEAKALADYQEKLKTNQRLLAIGLPPNEITPPPSIAASLAKSGAPPGLDTPAGDGQVSPGTGGTTDEWGMQKQYDQYNQGVQSQLAGLNKEASALGDLGKEQSGILRQGSAALQSADDEYKAKAQPLEAMRDSLTNDLKNGHIDPHQFWNSLDTGQKVMSTIGLILGGIGGGLTHQENPAMKFLNSQIDRDIEGQKLELGKKQNLLSANYQSLGDLRQATQMTRINQMDLIANKLKEAAARAQDPLAKANALKAAGQIEMTSAHEFQALKAQKTLMDNMGKGSSGDGEDPTGKFISQMRFVNPKQAEELSKRYIPGVGIGTVEVPDAARNEITARQAFDKRMADLIDFSKKNSGSFSPSIINQGKAMARGLQDAARQAAQLGVFKASENEFMNSIISDDPTAIAANIRVIPGYEQAKRDNNAALNAKKKAYGFKVVEPRIASSGWGGKR